MSAPANSVFQTVVASEQFAIHYESRRTEDTKLMRMAVSESQSCSCSRTGSSNPSPSSGESTNFRFLLMRACSPLQTIGGKVDVARHVPELDAALSVTTVAAGRLDVGEGGEIEIGEGLESLGSGCVAQAVGQPFRLAGEFHLRAKGDEEEGALAF